MSPESSNHLLCWNCRSSVAKDAIECPTCFAGVDPAARGLTEEAAAAEQASLQQPPSPPPTGPPGCATTAALTVFGIFAAVVVATAVGTSVNSQPCGEDLCEGYGGIFAGFAIFLIGVPAFIGVLTSLARRSRKETDKE